jgi:hypothetical protein
VSKKFFHKKWAPLSGAWLKEMVSLVTSENSPSAGLLLLTRYSK